MIRLNLGCGHDIKAGFINIDIRALPGVNIVCDASNLDDLFQDESIDEIYASNILEYFPFCIVNRVLENWIKKLKPNGRITIQVSDLSKILDKFRNNHLSIPGLQEFIFGTQEHEFDYRYSGYTEDILKDILAKYNNLKLIEITKNLEDCKITLIGRKL